LELQKLGGESMFKKMSVVLLTVLVLSVSIFAAGPWSSNTQVNTNTGVRTEPLYRNLPEGAKMTDITLKGVIKEIKVEPREESEIILEADGKEYEVHTGPIWMLGEIEEGMEIEITGRLIEVGDELYVVLTKAVINGEEIEVRENNFPVYAKNGREEGNRGNNIGRMGRKGLGNAQNDVRQNNRQNTGQNRGMRGRNTNNGRNMNTERPGTCIYNAD
jgi:hypothetical protein